tara:strand:+ start:777 stop:1049 length:273 start_codon:yes stop_codon:yes gene_type:complete
LNIPDEYTEDVIIKRHKIIYLTLNNNLLWFIKRNKKTKGTANKGPLLTVNTTAIKEKIIPNNGRVNDVDCLFALSIKINEKRKCNILIFP